jgi:type II secretory pathway pseudopilin PulG
MTCEVGPRGAAPAESLMQSGELLRVKGERGFTYLGVLLGVALIGVGLSVTATVWSKEADRQREAQADWVLAQYERALRSYYNAAPGSVRVLPADLSELLLDQRHLGTVRHLRKTYLMPCDQVTVARVQYRVQAPAVRLLLTCPLNGDLLASRQVSFDF